jgi:uncharacterized protein (DUF58 family)
MSGWIQRWWKGGGTAATGSGTRHSAPARPDAASSAAEGARAWMDVPTLMAMRSLELRVRRLVLGVQRGIHRSSRRGYSTEFSEYRPYTPGDDLRHLDWRRMARTDRPYVRQYEEESDWGCLVVVDLSASMAFGSLAHSKADYARTLAGTFASLLHEQGDPVGLLRFAADAGEIVPIRHSPRQMARWWALLEAAPTGAATSLGFALESSMRLMRRPGLVVVVSDFLTTPSTWAEPLRQLRAARHEVVCWEVLDPQELAFSFEGDTRFEDLESARKLDVHAASAREGYLQRLRAHREAVAAQCAAQGVALIEASTGGAFEPVLRAALEVVARKRPHSRGAG